MSVTSTSYAPAQYGGNDSTDVFPFTFSILDTSNLVVQLTDTNGAVSTLTTPTHYTATGGMAGGSVTMVTPPATGETLTISRSTPKSQTTSLRNLGRFLPATHERIMDKLTLILQELGYVATTTAATVISGTYTTATRPPATEALHRRLIAVKDTGADEQLQFCYQKSDGSYDWAVVFAGGN